MNTITTSRRVGRVALALTLAAVAGLGLTACQSAGARFAPEQVRVDPFAHQSRIEQSSNRMQERYAGRPADRIDDAIAREQALQEAASKQGAGRPADRIDDAIAHEEALQEAASEKVPGRPADRVDDDMLRAPQP